MLTTMHEVNAITSPWPSHGWCNVGSWLAQSWVMIGAMLGDGWCNVG